MVVHDRVIIDLGSRRRKSVDVGYKPNAKRNRAGGEIKARHTKAIVCSSRSPLQAAYETGLDVHTTGDNNYQQTL